MTPTLEPASLEPVRKSITVRAGAERAFRFFTEGFDNWWPRTHHIGSSPAKRFVVECKAGGRCYTEQIDGTDCPWGTVIEWEPPRRFVMAWQVSPTWQYEPNLANASEVEISFTALIDGSTRVDLEHRHFERHGAGGAAMRAMMDQPTAWVGVLELYCAAAEQEAA